MFAVVMKRYMHLHGISRRFGDFSALSDINVTIFEGELISFVGPSGSGKTTLLKLLAGIDQPTAGTIERWEPVSRDHPAILVFQDYLLFPHMTVFENVAFGLRSRRRHLQLERSDVKDRVCRYLNHLGIGDKAEVWPAQLSGGQKQRVALARALVMEPALLLLDEPFANLDKNLKGDTARFIRSLQRELGVTTVLVSHDLEEAGAVSDRIGVIIDGRLHQVASYTDIRRNPENTEVARIFKSIQEVP